MKRVLAVAGTIAVLFALMTCVGLWIPGLDIAFFLTAGWLWFLARVWPQMHIRWDLVGSGVVYVVILIIGSHYFIRWLYREMRRSGSSAPPAWKWRWTLAALALVMVMFAAGTAAVGLVHQTAWLVTTPRPLYSSYRVDRIKCASNLNQVGQAISIYADAHGGAYPDNFRPLITTCDLSAEVLVCPSSNEEKALGDSVDQIAENLTKSGHCSYEYHAKGLRRPVDENAIIVTEPIENHGGDGMNVLYGDGHVEWITEREVPEVLQKIKAQEDRPASTRPTNLTTKP